MNILFVCSRNQWRSPTAEAIYKNHPKHNIASAGTATSARIKITAKRIEWADIIFVMEKRHKQRLAEMFPMLIQNKDVVILDIADEYHYMDEELVEMIRSSVDPYLKSY